MEEDDVFYLGNNDEDEIFLGDTDGPKKDIEKNKVEISIDLFYEKLVDKWRKSGVEDYSIYLQQGNIEPKDIYGVLGLSPFQNFSENNIERLEELRSKLMKEADKFQRTDLSKTEDLKKAIGVLFQNFTNKKKNELFTETLKTSTWNRLTAVIKDKCSDKIVELYEMRDIYNAAIELGVFTKDLKKETKEKINKIIEETGSVIETVESAFSSFYDKYVKQNPNNNLDNEYNRKYLLNHFIQLKHLEEIILEKEKLADDKYGKEFCDLLKKLNITLVDPIKKFNDEFFTEFKNTHNISKPLSPNDFADLKSKFFFYGFNDDDWQNFQNSNKILVEESISLDEFNKIKKQNEKNLKIVNEKRSKMKKKIIIFVIIFAVLLGVGAILKFTPLIETIKLNNIKKLSTNSEYTRNEFTELLSTKYYTKETPEEIEVIIKKINPDWNRNAVNRAKILLKESSENNKIYSSKLLYDSLVSVGFQESEAKYGIDNLGYEWNKNALKVAQSWVEERKAANINSFTDADKDELKNKVLINKYYFTDNEADYAITAILETRKQDALKCAEDYLKSNDIKESACSKVTMKTLLIDNSYSAEEAQYAIDNLKCDWNKNALDFARDWIKNNKDKNEKVFTEKEKRNLADNILVSKYNFEKEEADFAIKTIENDFKNEALKYAESLLKSDDFDKKNCSKQGLYDILINDLYSVDYAKYVIDNIKCDWKQNAANQARNWIKLRKDANKNTFNKDERNELRQKVLINKYKFTPEEADHGISVIDSDRKNESKQLAASLLQKKDVMARSDLIESLLKYGYSNAEVEYAVNNIAWEWKKNAATMAETMVDQIVNGGGYVARTILQKALSELLFTPAEIEYAIDHLHVDWLENASKAIKAQFMYCKNNDVFFTRRVLRSFLSDTCGFKTNEIDEAMEDFDYDWKDECLKYIKARYENASDQTVENLLTDEGYTEKEIKHVLKKRKGIFDKVIDFIDNL